MRNIRGAPDQAADVLHLQRATEPGPHDGALRRLRELVPQYVLLAVHVGLRARLSALSQPPCAASVCAIRSSDLRQGNKEGAGGDDVGVPVVPEQGRADCIDWPFGSAVTVVRSGRASKQRRGRSVAHARPIVRVRTRCCCYSSCTRLRVAVPTAAAPPRRGAVQRLVPPPEAPAPAASAAVRNRWAHPTKVVAAPVGRRARTDPNKGSRRAGLAAAPRPRPAGPSFRRSPKTAGLADRPCSQVDLRPDVSKI